MTTRVILKNVEISYPNLFTAVSNENTGGDEQYSVTFKIKKNDVQINNLYQAIDKALEEKYGAEVPKMKGTFLRDGDESGWKGFEDCFFVAAKNKLKPKIYNKDNQLIYEEDDYPQSNDICDIVIDIWIQDNKFGKRINCWLQGVRLVKEGKRFIKRDDNLFGDVSNTVFDETDESPFN